jgi:hypothetical protein
MFAKQFEAPFPPKSILRLYNLNHNSVFPTGIEFAVGNASHQAHIVPRSQIL